MRRLFLLLIIVLIATGGYFYYQSSGQHINTAILGTASSQLVESGRTLLNQATGGQAEPVINKAVDDLQSRVKDLPQEQYEKVKYEFCKDML